MESVAIAPAQMLKVTDGRGSGWCMRSLCENSQASMYLDVPLSLCAPPSELRMAHIAGTDRTQAVLLPDVLDDYVTPDNPVRSRRCNAPPRKLAPPRHDVGRRNAVEIRRSKLTRPVPACTLVRIATPRSEPRTPTRAL
jgi:hypothetical protein